MSILTKLFSGGAADLVKGVGGVIDNLHTSKEEKLAAEQKIKELVAQYEIEIIKGSLSCSKGNCSNSYLINFAS